MMIKATGSPPSRPRNPYRLTGSLTALCLTVATLPDQNEWEGFSIFPRVVTGVVIRVGR